MSARGFVVFTFPSLPCRYPARYAEVARIQGSHGEFAIELSCSLHQGLQFSHALIFYH